MDGIDKSIEEDYTRELYAPQTYKLPSKMCIPPTIINSQMSQ